MKKVICDYCGEEMFGYGKHEFYTDDLGMVDGQFGITVNVEGVDLCPRCTAFMLLAFVNQAGICAGNGPFGQDIATVVNNTFKSRREAEERLRKITTGGTLT